MSQLEFEHQHSESFFIVILFYSRIKGQGIGDYSESLIESLI